MVLKGARGFGGTAGWWTNRYDQSKYHVINTPKIKLIKYPKNTDPLSYAKSILLLRSQSFPPVSLRFVNLYNYK